MMAANAEKAGIDKTRMEGRKRSGQAKAYHQTSPRSACPIPHHPSHAEPSAWPKLLR
jgi:hypothetical protein